MQVGDAVRITEGDVTEDVIITEIRTNSQVYAPAIRGRYIGASKREGGAALAHGLWPLPCIDKIEKIDKPFEDGDTFKGVHYTYERINGKWYIQTSFTDKTITNTLDPNKEPGSRGTNSIESSKAKTIANAVNEELKNRGSSYERGPDGDWCGR